MKLGIYDSGLGGLLIAKAIESALPDLDIVYLGDTLHLPYGKRSKDAIYDYACRAADYLFNSEDCALVIAACNTVSAAALRQIQQQYIPARHKDRNMLGVVVPTLEAALASKYKNIGILATEHTIQSRIYEQELLKLDPRIRIHQEDAPLLVPLIENDGLKWARPILKEYLEPLTAQNIECLILGCTHYPQLRSLLHDILGQDFPILSQDEIIPQKLSAYLERHPEYTDKISRSGTRTYCVTDITEGYLNTAHRLYNHPIEVKHVNI